MVDAPVLPTQIGPYRVSGLLGRGGMGVVYRAEDDRLGREVALKVLPEAAGSPHARERLIAEARAVARLDHPHICTVYEVGEDEGRVFLALACYEGETLASRLARGPLDPSEASELGRQLARGLGAAHARGIVHRDLKPSNVFLCEGDRGLSKILDFGIAKAEGVDLTQSGTTYGTLLYAAPEQATGHADARSDLWSLGVVLYEALAGRRPFDGAYDAARLYAILHEDPPPLPDSVPAPLAAAVMRLLEKDPAARFQTAADVEAALAEPTTAHPASPTATAPRSRWRWGRVLAVGAAVLALGVWGLPRALPAERHLAILPFEAEGPAEVRATADGLAASIANGIAGLGAAGGDLWVIPAREVAAEGVESAVQAREALGASLTLAGRFRQSADGMVLDLQVLDERGRQVRGRSVEAAGLGALRSEALRAITEMLDLEGARASRPEAQTDDPDAYAYYLQGLGYLQRDEGEDDLDRASTLFERAVEEDPAFTLAYARLGETYLGQYERTRDSAWVARAEAATRRALDLDDGAALVRVTRSRLFRTVGQYARAIQEAQRALDLDPVSAEAQSALAQALELSGDTQGARLAYEAAIALRPGLWSGYAQLGYALFRAGEYAAAAEQFAEVARLAPANYQGQAAQGGALHLLAQQAQSAGDADRARQLYAKVQAHYEAASEIRRTAGTVSNIATILVEQERHAEAVRFYREALTLDSTNHLLWANLAYALDAVPGRGRESRAATARAAAAADAQLRVNPRDADVLAALAVYRETLGQDEVAREAARDASRLGPTSFRTHFDLAMAFESLGDRTLALDHLAQALEGGLPLSLVEDHEGFAALRDTPRYRALAASASQ